MQIFSLLSMVEIVELFSSMSRSCRVRPKVPVRPQAEPFLNHLGWQAQATLGNGIDAAPLSDPGEAYFATGNAAGLQHVGR
ncbi:hypothetical protein [Mesorhizobium sp.]|uniref:hypothetical protein n=1 Tax=Mesorhizobium sp. TaxID=1871066 RepID=UPI000FE63925|nr:hypothetical protein [Mesorhizobium sp.]RWK60040.1 MAG: hypothetical protein EOR49_23115 [Mesorhizobium sp.]RWM44762.1 MAG: hypothetical protein EOR76_23315 [Mesorhizobium sp.]RWM55725.1 MAG: hypothetical protein EOR78_14710 [Mesorhizobium sp.]RWN05144.1 MAG: hypothetical protein EOR85_00155 [Mesorhizobium sp.]TIO65881.1 MAG: hypothetical protein E5X85_26425 [Mesorhizobium sp.]